MLTLACRQWGNLLVLSACYRDPFLRREIDGNKLKDLFKKTIAFLRQVSTLTSALRVDQRLLESIYQKLFETSSVMMQPNASFSSTASGTTPGQPQRSPMESTHGQGSALAPMRPPPDHASMMAPAQHPVGVRTGAGAAGHDGSRSNAGRHCRSGSSPGACSRPNGSCANGAAPAGYGTTAAPAQHDAMSCGIVRTLGFFVALITPICSPYGWASCILP